MQELTDLIVPLITWLVLILYTGAIIGVAVQVIYETTSPSKTLGYLLLIIFIPLLGVILYLSIGVNYRNRNMYTKKVMADDATEAEVKRYIKTLKHEALELDNPAIQQYENLARYIASDRIHWLSQYNDVTLLNNGEEKFPEVLKALENAKSTIHIEYYIVRNDKIGNAIKEVLIRKAKEGVKVRFIYDDFGSGAIRKTYADELRAAGVEIYPFRKLIFIMLANRLNYRNHRKIIVVDGVVGFVGGINIGDEYINDGKGAEDLYYRDTHVKVVGYSCYSLQYIFLSDWNFCANQRIVPSEKYFPHIDRSQFDHHQETAQIVASGPDSPEPMIMNSLILAIANSKREVLITTPYFVPSEMVLSALKMAAMSDVKVKVLIPKKTNSFFVRCAANSLFETLMDAGVEIYHYERGFIHAKTSVFDRKVAMVGTANMDNRSFDLNFEVNAVVYDEPFAKRMADDFFEDLSHATKIDPLEWKKSRSKARIFFEKAIYLSSSLL